MPFSSNVQYRQDISVDVTIWRNNEVGDVKRSYRRCRIEVLKEVRREVDVGKQGE
mgnify:CR=1 FL=1